MDNLVEIYCDVDDFCRVFLPEWEKTEAAKRPHETVGNHDPDHSVLLLKSSEFQEFLYWLCEQAFERRLSLPATLKKTNPL